MIESNNTDVDVYFVTKQEYIRWSKVQDTPSYIEEATKLKTERAVLKQFLEDLPEEYSLIIRNPSTTQEAFVTYNINFAKATNQPKTVLVVILVPTAVAIVAVIAIVVACKYYKKRKSQIVYTALEQI